MTQPNVFFFNQDVVWQAIESFSNTLATSMYAIPYNEFDYNPKNGMTYQLLYPVQQIAKEGIAYDPANIESIVQRKRPITLNGGFNATFNLSWDQTSFTDGADSQQAFANMYLIPNVRALGDKINRATILDMAKYFSDTIGDPSSALNGLTTISTANIMLANMSLSHFQKKYFQLSPNATNGLQTPYATYFNQGFNTSILEKDTTDFSKQYSGLNPYIDQSYYTVVNGSFAAPGNVTVLVAPSPTTDINQEFSSITLTGFAFNEPSVLKIFNRITFESPSNTFDKVYQINPRSYQSISNPKSFVVLNEVDSDGGGNAIVEIYPPVVSATDDPYRLVSRPIAVGDKVQLIGGQNATYVLNFVYVDQGLRFANPPISTGVITSPNSLFGGFPYQQVMTQKIPNSMMTLSLNVSASGNHPMFSNTLSSRAITAAASFNGYGFASVSNQ